MDILNTQFPFFGKLQENDEVYIISIYDPISFEESENNKRFSVLSYMDLKFSSEIYPYVYPTVNSRDKIVSKDLLFTPVITNISTFVVSNVCNNKFSLKIKIGNVFLPVYLSKSLNQLNNNDVFDKYMFTVSSNDSNNIDTFETQSYNYSSFYGKFEKLNYDISPIYKLGCILNQCNCIGKNCCIPNSTNSLNIVSNCEKQENSKNKYNNIMIIPKIVKTSSVNGIIYNDNNTIFNFTFLWDLFLNQKITINDNYFYSSSLFESIEISKKVYKIKYCTNENLCGTNGCYGSCNSNCLIVNTKCQVLSENAQCGIDKKDSSNNFSFLKDLGLSNILGIIALLLSIIIIITFIIISLKKGNKYISKS